MDIAVSLQAGQAEGLDWEVELIERARTDRQAFGELYRRYYPTVAAYVLRRVGQRHAAEDVVNEVFLSAMKAIRRYEHRGLPVRAWFYRIATHAVNRWAVRQRRWRWLLGEARSKAIEAASRSVESEWDFAVATIALTRISPKLQAVLVLHYGEGLSVEETAQVLNVRAGTVKSRLSRGREALRDVILRRS